MTGLTPDGYTLLVLHFLPGKTTPKPERNKQTGRDSFRELLEQETDVREGVAEIRG